MAKRKQQVDLDEDQAAELFIGGIAGCLQIADRLGLSASTGGALVMALNAALPDLSPQGIVTAYNKLDEDDDLSSSIREALLAVTRQR